ncbi:MAG TPA: DUF3108 domain-containing protein, partial [Bacteroidota bacterium]|nr:DUF3108 domain-containing protein [Bacteroidota bacterium]
SAAARRADSLIAASKAAAADSLRRIADSLASAERAAALVQLRTIDNVAFGTGERLVFDVNYGFITAGEAVLEIPALDTIAGRQCYRVEFRVNSLPSFSWIYRVQDRYVTYIDAGTIAPWKFEQHVREGSYSRDFIAEFDQRRNTARTADSTYPVPQYVHDILSAFYFARTIDYGPLKAGDQIQLSNFYKDKTYDLIVRVLGRQQLEVAAGTFNTVVIEPLVKEGGLIKVEGRIVVWLTDDQRKIPVRVNTKVVIGSIDTELKAYTGIRGPVPSRVK